MENEEAMNSKYPRKLNFNAPLLSIRRSGGYTDEEQSCTNSQGVLADASDDRIPFSWEQAPGKPKDLDRGDTSEVETPRPRLPPCLWHPDIEAMSNDYPYDANDDLDNAVDDLDDLDDLDDGCDGDVDDDYDDDAAFSDAMDVFSLSEAIDIVTKAEKVQEFDSLKLKLAESRGSESPNFIIRRFLPDATALAASSALAFSKNFNKRPPRQCNCPEACELHPVIGQSYAPPKGCGLEILFPWRMKHKICGVKSPIRKDSLKVQPQSREKPKKHGSSSSKPLPM